MNNLIRRAMKLPAVRAATSYSEPTIYRKMAAGTFPKGVKIDPNSRAVIWWEDEIIAYQQAAIRAAEQAA